MWARLKTRVNKWKKDKRQWWCLNKTIIQKWMKTLKHCTLTHWTFGTHEKGSDQLLSVLIRKTTAEKTVTSGQTRTLRVILAREIPVPDNNHSDLQLENWLWSAPDPLTAPPMASHGANWPNPITWKVESPPSQLCIESNIIQSQHFHNMRHTV